MGDDRRDCNDEASRERGGAEFLDLEISQVLYGEAQGIVREAFRELLKEHAKRRIEARMGGQLEALAELAVDELLADVEANLAIERRIEERERQRAALAERLRAVFADRDAPAPDEPADDTPPEEA